MPKTGIDKQTIEVSDMKFIKSLALVIVLCALGAVGVIFWPKIREYCDRWLACQSSGDTGEPGEAEVIEEESATQAEES
jgi:hypothetical protein